MNINATLFGQMITFAIFVWFTMRFVWPLLHQELELRKKTIADGLAAAELGEQKLQNAEKKIAEHLQEAKAKGAEILHEARNQAQDLLQVAEREAQLERKNILDAGVKQIEHATEAAKEELKSVLATLVVDGAQQLLEREVKAEDHQQILERVVDDLNSN